MKMSRKTAKKIASLWVSVSFLMMIMQAVFITMKCTGAVDWSWWVIMLPLFCMAGLPFVTIVLVIIGLLPKAIIKERKRVQTQPGESIGEQRKRIIVDMILRAFPNVGSCRIYVGDQTRTIVLFLKKAENAGASTFSDDELKEISNLSYNFIPLDYKVTAINAEDKDGEEKHTKTYN